MGINLFSRWARNRKVDDRADADQVTVRIVDAPPSPPAVSVAGRVSVDSSPHLRTLLLDLLSKARNPLIVIDLSEVSYLDMSGIATLLEALKAADRRSVKLRIVGMTGQVKRLSQITRLDEIFRTAGAEVELE